MNLRILVHGAGGRMGAVTCQAITTAPDLDLVASTHRADDLQQAIIASQAQVVVDFTHPEVAFLNCQIILNTQAHPVIGTSGITTAQRLQLQQRCQALGRGAVIAPNFSLAAVLMMQCAARLAHYLPQAEIIEMHHPAKKDAPSATAIKTAEMIQQGRQDKHLPAPTIHSVRVLGQFARQQVIFGQAGETLTLDHNSIDRQCMMPGVLMCCRQVVSLNHLVYGLEGLIE